MSLCSSGGTRSRSKTRQLTPAFDLDVITVGVLCQRPAAAAAFFVQDLEPVQQVAQFVDAHYALLHRRLVDTAAAPSGGLPNYAPIPAEAFRPALNADGYVVGRIDNNLYWVTDSFYQAMFLTTRQGVVLVDAPPTIGRNLLRAIDPVTWDNGRPTRTPRLDAAHRIAGACSGKRRWLNSPWPERSPVVLSGTGEVLGRDRATLLTGGVLLLTAIAAWAALLVQPDLLMPNTGLPAALVFLTAWAVMMAAMMRRAPRR